MKIRETSANIDNLIRAAYLLGTVLLYVPPSNGARAPRLVSMPDPRGAK